MPDFFNISDSDSSKSEEKPKFAKDAFYMKDMELMQIPYSQDLEESTYSLLAKLGSRFKRNDTTGIIVNSPIPYVDQKPLAFLPGPFMDKVLARANEAQDDMIEIEKIAKKRRKDRAKEFLAIIKEYLASLTPEQLSDHRWHDPNYVSDYNEKTCKPKPKSKINKINKTDKI